MININLVPWKREGCTMQQNTWRYQHFVTWSNIRRFNFKSCQVTKIKKSASKSPCIITDPIKKNFKSRTGRVKRTRSCIRKINDRKGHKNRWQHKTWELESEKEVIRVKKNPIKIKKVNPRPSKEGHDQEKLNKSKRTSQRYDPKDSGN